jgi:predicted metal-dependent hydrolase
MAKSQLELWEIKGQDIPVKIIQEWRRNNSISIGRQYVTLRVNHLDARVGGRLWQKWAYNWLIGQMDKKPEIFDRFKIKMYKSGDVIRTPRAVYPLVIGSSVRKSSAAWIRGGELIIDLNNELSTRVAAKTCQKLIARTIGKHQHKAVSQRIRELNAKYFQKEIKAVRIKNNSSNWGSCSNTGNINISARTLLLPLATQDYVFVHELSHLIELNHSKRYWSLVARAMPEYKQHEQWIKDYGESCVF